MAEWMAPVDQQISLVNYKIKRKIQSKAKGATLTKL